MNSKIESTLCNTYSVLAAAEQTHIISNIPNRAFNYRRIPLGVVVVLLHRSRGGGIIHIGHSVGSFVRVSCLLLANGSQKGGWGKESQSVLKQTHSNCRGVANHVDKNIVDKSAKFSASGGKLPISMNMQKRISFPRNSGTLGSPERDRIRPTCVSWANTFPCRFWPQMMLPGWAVWPPKLNSLLAGAPKSARAFPVARCANGKGTRFNVHGGNQRDNFTATYLSHSIEAGQIPRINTWIVG